MKGQVHKQIITISLVQSPTVSVMGTSNHDRLKSGVRVSVGSAFSGSMIIKVGSKRNDHRKLIRFSMRIPLGDAKDGIW